MNGNKRWGRRVGATVTWAVLNYALILLQPTMGLGGDLISLVLEKSTWIVGILIVGLSGTDAMKDYVEKKK